MLCYTITNLKQRKLPTSFGSLYHTPINFLIAGGLIEGGLNWLIEESSRRFRRSKFEDRYKIWEICFVQRRRCLKGKKFHGTMDEPSCSNDIGILNKILVTWYQNYRSPHNLSGGLNFDFASLFSPGSSDGVCSFPRERGEKKKPNALHDLLENFPRHVTGTRKSDHERIFVPGVLRIIQLFRINVAGNSV